MGPNGSAVLTFIGRKQTDRQAKYINKYKDNYFGNCLIVRTITKSFTMQGLPDLAIRLRIEKQSEPRHEINNPTHIYTLQCT